MGRSRAGASSPRSGSGSDSLRATGFDGLDTITLLLELPPLGAPRGGGFETQAELGVADLQVSLVDKGVVVIIPTPGSCHISRLGKESR